MTTSPIKFGTSGWRGVIADDFTFDNVRRVAGAIASYVLKYEDSQRGVIIGYDTRFGSPGFARLVAGVIANAGIPVSVIETSEEALKRGLDTIKKNYQISVQRGALKHGRPPYRPRALPDYWRPSDNFPRRARARA